MGFTPYSQVVQPAQYQPDIPLDIYQKGQEHLDSENKQAISNLDAQVSQLASIPTVSESDKQILDQKLQDVKANLSKISLGNVGSPQGQQQIRGYLSQVSNDPDIQAIAARGYTYRNALQEKKDAEKEGKQYWNYALDQAQDYQKQGVYVRDTRFNNQGGLAPDEAKMMEEAKKIVEPTKKTVGLGNGNYQTVEYRDPDKLAAALKTIQDGNPNYKSFQDYTFKNATKDVDWNVEAQNHFGSIIDTAQNTYLLAASNLQNAKTPQQQALYQGVMDKAQQDISKYSNVAGTPQAGIEMKNRAYQTHLDQQLYSQVSAMDALQQGDIKMDEHSKMQQQLSNDLYKTRTEEIYKSLIPGLGSLPPKQQAKFLKGDLSGINIAEMQKAANDALLNKEVTKVTATTTARESAKYEFKKKRGASLGDGKVPGDTLIPVGDGPEAMVKTKDEWIKSIDRMKLGKAVEDDKTVALAIIKDSPEQFGLTPLQAGNIVAKDLAIGNGKIELNEHWYTPKTGITFASQLETALYGNLGGDKSKAPSEKTTNSSDKTYSYGNEKFTYDDLIKKYGTKERADSAIHKFNMY